MGKIFVSDVTMKQAQEGLSLSFKEKIELAKLLDRLGTDIIEIEGIENARVDGLRIKSIAAAVTESTVAVPVALTEGGVQAVWNALQLAKKPRLQVCAPVSPVQMEYLYHKKPDAMLAAIEATVKACKAVCSDVEFVAQDATRSEKAFLYRAVQTALEAGAATVTVCDTAGQLLPTEFASFIRELKDAVPGISRLGVWCANTLSLADACAVGAISSGSTEIKAAAWALDTASLENIARLLSVKGEGMGISSGLRVTQLSRIMEQIAWICQGNKQGAAPASSPAQKEVFLTAHDDCTAVSQAVQGLGYDLSQEDTRQVYEAFLQIAEKKDQVTAKELDAIVASAAMQVPSTYKLDTYVVTSGNTISATAHIKLLKNGQAVEGVYMGDGAIDAAFKAIETITGCDYELDDFQLQAVTEGREAMGQTVVKLRSGGKVYSGRGISTDIVGAGIQAYLSALNKILYEEESL